MTPGSSRTALFISPHLDDAAFSCGGTLALLAREGWQTVLATVFTRSVLDPVGFALACQLDKGLSPDVDYMALRRDEDQKAAKHLGVGETVWLDLPEAPHRGYGSAPELFTGTLKQDEVWRDVAGLLEDLLQAHDPEILFAPQALGNHADHLQVVRAVREQEASRGTQVAWYRDAPYATRNPWSRPSPLLPAGLSERTINIAGTLEAKLAACAAYATQLGFQFGGEENMREALTDFAAAEARRLGTSTTSVESVLFRGTELPFP